MSALQVWDPTGGRYVDLALGESGALPVEVAGAAAQGVARPVALLRATASGSVPAGAISVTIRNSGTADASVAGAVLHTTESVTFSADAGNTLASIAYTVASGGELFVSVVGVTLANPS